MTSDTDDNGLQLHCEIEPPMQRLTWLGVATSLVLGFTISLVIAACVALAACVSPLPQPPDAGVSDIDAAREVQPACAVTTRVDATRSLATISGDCSAPAHLRGGAVSADDTPYFFADLAVPCPFEVGLYYPTPSVESNWSYVLHLEDGRVPGAATCTGDHAEQSR